MNTSDRTGASKPTTSSARSARTTSLKLPDELKRRLQKVAESQRRSAHWLMLDAVETYVSRAERREQFRLDAEASWRDYVETGLHLSGEEVDEWLRRRANGEAAELPQPHR